METEVEGACSMYGGEQSCLDVSCRKGCVKETARKTYAFVEGNIKMDIKNSMEGVDSIHVADDRVKRQTHLRAVMNIRVP